MEATIKKMLLHAGIEVGGKKRGDITVHNPRFYSRILKNGTLGIGESYMDGDWDSNDLTETANKAFKVNLRRSLASFSLKDAFHVAHSYLTNLQTKKRSYDVGEEHYDVGNDLYEAMLGKSMAYTCAYWRNGAKTLDEAQNAKFDLVCRKVGLKSGDSILDLGCGFGSFLRYAAEKYGVSGLGVTVSKEQARFANERNKDLPVQVLVQDYRDPILDDAGNTRVFDHVISIGLCEHVGPRNYRTLMQVVDRHLKPGGLLLLHTIGQPKSIRANDAWTHKYIFPNSQAPSLAQIARSAEKIFNIEDVHTFGTDYEPTVLAWYKNFSDAWPMLKEIKKPDGTPRYTERFRRMWEFYLLCGAGLSRSQKSSLWQIVFSRGDIAGGYRSIR
ncbi:MAG: cyclopropane fatty acyl phospholipid synthase [Patescibacteria group bacterium]|nr:cyclopropane fatty acyl phospholipid synthase [Patescibacteria group bacterium]